MMSGTDQHSSSSTAAAHEIRIMDKVCLVSDPSTIGLVCGIAPMGNITRYEVFVNGGTRIFYTG